MLLPASTHPPISGDPFGRLSRLFSCSGLTLSVPVGHVFKNGVCFSRGGLCVASAVWGVPVGRVVGDKSFPMLDRAVELVLARCQQPIHEGLSEEITGRYVSAFDLAGRTIILDGFLNY